MTPLCCAFVVMFVFSVVVKEHFAFGVKDCYQVEFYVACHQRAGIGRKLVSKLNAREQKFNRRKKIFDLPKIQWKI
jgi:hypothetical protein